jgi:hypothetical protein
MITIQEIRKKYPEYKDLSDEQIAENLHQKHYSDMPKDYFFSKIGIKPKQDYSAEQEWQSIQQKHPYLSRISEALQGMPGLETAGNAAGKFNEIVQGTGLPNAAKGFFETSANAIRGVGNLIPGVNIPEQRTQTIPEINPLVQNIAEFGGGLLTAYPTAGIYKAAEKATKLTPYLKKAPETIQKILAGGVTGAAVSPDERLGGALIGGGLTAAGEAPGLAKKAIEKVMPTNPYKVIQQGYDKKKEAASKLFEAVGKDVKKSDVKIELPKNLISEILELGPKTKTFKSFVKKAEEGNYESLRKLNTELFHRGEKKAASLMGSDNDLAEMIFEKRDELNKSIIDSLKQKGMTDQAKDLQKARNQWKSLQDTYHSNNAISKLVGKNREVPANLNLLKKDATDINKLKKMHPEIEKYLKLQKNVKRAGTGLGLAGIGGGLNSAYKSLTD